VTGELSLNYTKFLQCLFFSSQAFKNIRYSQDRITNILTEGANRLIEPYGEKRMSYREIRPEEVE
jgi:hypothetical protein